MRNSLNIDAFGDQVYSENIPLFVRTILFQILNLKVNLNVKR